MSWVATLKNEEKKEQMKLKQKKENNKDQIGKK